MRYLKIFILTIAIFCITQANCQTLQLGSATACLGDTITIPINMTAIDSVGAITLFIGYDTTSLKFVSLVNITPLAPGTMFNDVHTGTGNTGPLASKVAISWVTIGGGVNFVNTIYANLKFKILGNSCALTLLPGCEISDWLANTITVNYNNGYVNAIQSPSLSIQPTSTSIISGQNVRFATIANSATTKQWQQNQGSGWNDIYNNTYFNGVLTDTLTITQPNISYTGTAFRLKLTNNCFTSYSDSVVLTITSSITINNQNAEPDIKVFPNPVNDFINIKNKNPLTTITNINIYLLNGVLFKKISLDKKVNKNININTSALSNGKYIIEVAYKINNINKSVSYKFIKTN